MRHTHFAFLCLSIAVSLGVALTATNAWADSLISLNAPVTVAATDTRSGAGYLNGSSGNVSDITNGTFLPNGTGYWSTQPAVQALEWCGNEYVFQINLGATAQIDSITLQADNNDEYVLQYLNESTGQWQLLWDRGEEGGWGLMIDSYTLTTPIDTSEVRILGGASQDSGLGGYAVAQVELFGTSTTVTPEPSSFLLLGSGLVALAGIMRRKIGLCA